MSDAKYILMRMFGRPEGTLGKLGGIIMARSNRKAAAWAIELLKVAPNERILEIGFGPGVAIDFIARSAPGIHVAGIDSSRVMLR